MTDLANRSYLRLCVAKICLDVGFNSIQSTPLEVLTDLLQDYIKTLAKTAYNYALHCGSTEPNLNHLTLAFKDMGVSINELQEYVRYVDSSSVFDCPKYPIPKESHLNLLKPGSREVVTRPVHVHEHLPPMHPHLEDQDISLNQEINAENSSDSSSPVNSSKSKTFKRPGDASSEILPAKRSRYISEEEGRPLRELSSVMMTTSGFLSPAREGKLPEARTPLIKNEFPLAQEANVNTLNVELVQKPKKKGKLSPDHKKVEKDVKIITEKEIELTTKDDSVKQKRLNSGKDSVKKSKIASSKGNIVTSPSMTNTVKSHKQGNKIKNSPGTVSALATQTNVKIVKAKSPKNDKHNVSILKDTPSMTTSNLVGPEYKIASEVDKQKLSIIRRISKIKEEIPEDVDEKPLFEPDSLSRVDVTIESVIKREMVCSETSPQQETDTKEEVVDIETVHSPNPYDSLVTSNVDIPYEKSVGFPTTLIIKQEKKKKKFKKSNAKDVDTNDGIPQAKPVKVLSKSPPDQEKVEAIIQESQGKPISHITTQTIPDKICCVALVSHVPELDKKEQVAILTPEPVSSEKLQNIVYNANNDRKDVPVPSSCVAKNEDFGLEIVPKKLHKKEKKDKLKKKKKDKIKNKEKSEKRKLKLEKKVKAKKKQRIKKGKKEKRKEKENEEVKSDGSNAVPKITLKLGTVSPSNNHDNNPLKIVIIPVVKKDDPVKTERAPSPELARFSPLVPNPKQKPSRNSVAEKTQITPEVKEGDIVEPSPSIRVDSEGNKVWICPACERQDDGTPMIGCDKCDAWYHWVCVGIQVPPEVTNWYCHICLSKKKVEFEKKKKNKKKGVGKKSKV